MHDEYSIRVIESLLAMKGRPDDALLDQVWTIGVTTTRNLLFNEAVRLQHADQVHADQVTATDCAALVDRIDALIRRDRHSGQKRAQN
jgi:hypothetical protein